ncbi:hypothetical protein [Herbaspirillum sp.]|uniref:hypothetical protein n=1 Tax=Herbaspirillum sp. TaxID=1890675 RepID=UPI001B25ABCB|nr:hypothetical protein [Herbaspirillum sp.]MBO9536273.1 hypothetical protein [Herbaspirillum sp.]
MSVLQNGIIAGVYRGDRNKAIGIFFSHPHKTQAGRALQAGRDIFPAKRRSPRPWPRLFLTIINRNISDRKNDA